MIFRDELIVFLIYRVGITSWLIDRDDVKNNLSDLGIARRRMFAVNPRDCLAM